MRAWVSGLLWRRRERRMARAFWRTGPGRPMSEPEREEVRAYLAARRAERPQPD